MAYKPQAGAQMASPNVIPMADIMLVLLIIFMVITPMLHSSLASTPPSPSAASCARRASLMLRSTL